MKKAASNTKNLPAPRLLRSGAVTAGATFMSRILGMFRDIAIAGLLGAGLSADVYFFANRIPNFFRRLFAEGAFAQAFVPVMTKTKRDKSEEELKELAAKSAGTLGLIVLIISILLVKQLIMHHSFVMVALKKEIVKRINIFIMLKMLTIIIIKY